MAGNSLKNFANSKSNNAKNKSSGGDSLKSFAGAKKQNNTDSNDKPVSNETSFNTNKTNNTGNKKPVSNEKSFNSSKTNSSDNGAKDRLKTNMDKETDLFKKKPKNKVEMHPVDSPKI